MTSLEFEMADTPTVDEQLREEAEQLEFYAVTGDDTVGEIHRSLLAACQLGAQEVERLTAENERLSDLLDATETSHGILNQDLLAAEVALAEARAENVIGDGCAECGTKIAGEPMWCRQCAEEVERDKEYICAVCGHERTSSVTRR